MGALVGVWEWSRLLKGEKTFVQKGDWGKKYCSSEDPTSFSLGLTLTNTNVFAEPNDSIKIMCFPAISSCWGMG